MTNLEQAARQALEALNTIVPYEVVDYDPLALAIAALRQALEQKQEPVTCNHGWFRTGAMAPGEARCIKCGEWKEENHPKREWTWLTDDEIEDLYFDNFSMSDLEGYARAIEAKLKEKNT